MLIDLSTAFLKDILNVLKTDVDFFKKSKTDRESIVKKHYGQSYSDVLTSYFVDVEESSFMDDVHKVLDLYGGFSVDFDGEFFDVLVKFVVSDFGYKLDELDSSFFFDDVDSRKDKLARLFSGKSFVYQFLKELFFESTYQELSLNACEFLSSVKDVETIVVQSPKELSKELKHEIRKYYMGVYKNSFVEFQINPQIIGGIRVFVNGDVVDNSWLAEIQKISSLSLI